MEDKNLSLSLRVSGPSKRRLPERELPKRKPLEEQLSDIPDQRRLKPDGSRESWLEVLHRFVAHRHERSFWRTEEYWLDLEARLAEAEIDQETQAQQITEYLIRGGRRRSSLWLLSGPGPEPGEEEGEAELGQGQAPQVSARAWAARIVAMSDEELSLAWHRHESRRNSSRLQKSL